MDRKGARSLVASRAGGGKPTHLGTHAPRIAHVRALLSGKGRRQSGRFAFEGATLLHEADRSGVSVEELYATQAAYDGTPLVAELARRDVPTFIVDERAAAKMSDLDTPSGIVAVAAMRLTPLEQAFSAGGIVLALADLNDPGNAGTLVRAADAFGCGGVVFGNLGADPYHPKVVRAAMGSVFRVPVAVAGPSETFAAADAAGFERVELDGSGEPLRGFAWAARTLLVVGHERHGLGRWTGPQARHAGIPMTGQAESLNAAVAGSIALYEATKRSHA